MRFHNQDDRSSSRSVSMHKAVCDKCHKDCEVPFRPTGDKPIYCSDCFKGKSGGDSRQSGGGRDYGRKLSFGSKEMHKAVCSKCGENCEVPFRPTGSKPVYCSNCFEKSDGGSSRGSDRGPSQTDKQLELLNNKLDKIIELLAPTASKKADKEVKVVKEDKKEKKAEKKETAVKEKKVAKKAVKKPAKKKAAAKKRK